MSECLNDDSGTDMNGPLRLWCLRSPGRGSITVMSGVSETKVGGPPDFGVKNPMIEEKTSVSDNVSHF